MSVRFTPVEAPVAPLTLAASPGEILAYEFLKPLSLTRYRLAKETGLSQTQIGEILRGSRSITAATALRFGAYFGNTPRFWLNLQNNFDLIEATARIGQELKSITPNPITKQLVQEGPRLTENETTGG